MEKLEDFYMSDGEYSGETIFNDFASKHSHLFEGEF